jgi:mono/diheme cytochrome c family protein
MTRGALVTKPINGMLVMLTLFLLVPNTAPGEDALPMPLGEGRDLVSAQCTGCHGLSTALVKRASPEVWAETVNRMVETYMAPVNDTDKAIILTYLATHFGEDSSYSPGQQMLAEQCFRCHGDGMWRGLKTDRAGWLSVIYRMVGRGGQWSTDQINVMADYLATTYSQGDGE